MRPAEPIAGLRARLRSPYQLAWIALNLALFYLLLGWVFENIQPKSLLDSISRIPVWALAVSASINIAVLVLIGMRMALLLGKGFRVGFPIVNFGYALNALLPLRLGDVIKIYLGHRLYGVPLLGMFAASAAEKLADLFLLMLIALAMLAFAAGLFVQFGLLAAVSGLVALGAAGFVLFRLHIVRILRMLPKRGRLRRIAIELHKHAGSYPVARILSVTAVIWVLNAGQVYFTFNAFLPGLGLSLAQATTLLLIIALAIAIPSAPAGIGLFEAGIVAYLTRLGSVGNEAALAAAAVFHLVVTLPQLVIAGAVLAARGIAASKRQ